MEKKPKKKIVLSFFGLCALLFVGIFLFQSGRLYLQEWTQRNEAKEVKQEQNKEKIQYKKAKEKEEERLSLLNEEIQSLLKNQSALVGFSFYDLTTKETLSLNANIPFQAGSTFYIPVALIVADKIYAKQLDPKEEIPYEGITPEVNEGEIYKNPKESYTIEELLRLMLAYNDSIAYEMLVQVLGGEKEVLQYLQQYYDKNQPVKEKEPCLTAGTALYYLRLLYENPTNNPEYIKIQKWLLKSGNSGLATKTTREKMAHRSSFREENYHDIGIYYGAHPYIVTIYTKGDRDGDYIIGQISDDVYKMVQKEG